jgi:membrane fusion protein (multidrug efflux system)
MTNRTVLLLGLISSLLPPMLWAQTGGPPAPEVIVAEVMRERIADRVEALGTTRANESVVLTSRVAETVRRLRFEDGQAVQAGDVLVELTSDEEDAQLEEAKSRVREARRQFRRVRDLAEKNQAAQSQLDERRREVETAEARLDAIEARLADHLITAPFDGVLGLRQVSPGAYVEPGTVITTLSDLSMIKLDFSVPATYLGVLRPGLPIVARSRAYEDRAFEGSVSYVNTEVDPITRSVLVRALLPNPERLLRPGLLMTVVLQKNPREALVIPEAALIPRGRDNDVIVIGAEGQVSPRRVRLGLRLPGRVEILEGLSEGERVVTHGGFKLRPGQRVTVRALEREGDTLERLLEPAAAAR